MPEILTTKHKIFCPHGGEGTSVPADPSFQIGNAVGLLEGDGGSIDNKCKSLAKCKTYILTSMGLNASSVRSRSVILITDFNITDTGVPLIIVPAGTGVIDDSVPLSIPPGEEAPPLSPELADTVKPVVTGTPSSIIYSLALPKSITVTFTLFSKFPKEWRLILLRGTPSPGSEDLTGGLSGAEGSIVPAGGIWNTPHLTVTMTLEPAFMARLGAGEHSFFMAGINKRGLSGFNDPPVELIVTV